MRQCLIDMVHSLIEIQRLTKPLLGAQEMIRHTKFFSTLLAITLSGCATTNVRIEVPPGIDHASWTSYAWLETFQPRSGDPRIDVSALDEQIRSAIERELNKHGYKRSAADQADVLLVYRVMVRTKQDKEMASVYDDYAGIGGNRLYSPAFGEPVLIGKQFIYEEGSLNIDIIDSESHDLLWRGSTRKTVVNKTDPDKRRKRVDQTVHEILERLPERQGIE